MPEVAKRLGRDPETVRRWIRAGKVRAHKVGTQHFIDERDMDSLAERNDSLPLPDDWKTMRDGKPQPNWVGIIRRSRRGH